MLCSALSSSYRITEVVVLDDCVTDAIVVLIELIKYSGVSIAYNPTNLGSVAT